MPEGPDTPIDQNIIVVPEGGTGKGFSRADIEKQADKPASEFSRKIEISQTDHKKKNQEKEPETVDIKEKDPQTLTFSESLKEIGRIQREYEKFKKTKKEGDRFPAAEARRIVDVRKKRDEHLANADEEGELDEVQERTEPLSEEIKQMEEADSVSSADHKEMKGILRGESRDARDYSNDEEVEEREGVGRHVYLRELTKLRERVVKIAPTEAAQQQGQLDGEGLANILKTAMIEALSQEKMTKSGFLRNERWAEHAYEFNINQAPPFHKEMSSKEKQEFEARVELHHAVYVKRYGAGGFSLEGVSKNTILGKINKQQTKLLYQKAGVRSSLEEYVAMMDNPDDYVFTRTDGSKFKVAGEEVVGDGGRVEVSVGVNDREFESEVVRNDMVTRLTESQGFRDSAIEELKESLVARLTESGASENESRQKVDEELQRFAQDEERQEEVETLVKEKAIEAEQVAFNMHFAGNMFESLGAKWEGERRTRASQLNIADFSQVPLRDQMAPLGALIGKTAKDLRKRGITGRFSEWAATQTKKNARGREIGIDEVQIIDDMNPANKNKFWTFTQRDGKKVLLAPECYPRKSIGSIWEETEVKRRANGQEESQNLLHFLRNREEIPWHQVEEGGVSAEELVEGAAQGMWNDYTFDMGKEAIIWNVLETGSSVDSTDVTKALARRGKRGDYKQIRWMIYADRGISIKDREPRLIADNESKKAIRQLYTEYTHTIPEHELFFPWDKPSRFTLPSI